ncbi:MAG: galactokinase [Chloroflexi bacterium]|nr:galactokinase [Chloroflexota bacterium]
MSAHELHSALQIYGHDQTTLDAQDDRYARALAAFRDLYGPGPVAIYRAPGRVNLIGEHTDYNHGYVLPVALDKDVLILARARGDRVVRLASPEAAYEPRQFEISADIPPQPTGDWANYVQGPAQLLTREFAPDLRGCDALVEGAPPFGVPRGAGLSSSSALVVAAAVALAGVNQLALSGERLADACSRAEWYVGTRGGIMDHFASVLAHSNSALFLDCRPVDGRYPIQHVPIPPGYAVIVADSGVRHRNTGPHFNRRVLEGRIGVRLLQRHYPGITHLRDVDQIPWPVLEPLLPEVIETRELLAQGIDPHSLLDQGRSAETDTFCVRKRSRHVITENNRVLQSVAALRAGDAATFGRLMGEAHASARDDYEISTPEIETLIELANAVPGAVGARLTGAGWGGCIVALVHEESASAFAETLVSGYHTCTGLDAQVFLCRSAAGAGEVWQGSV